MPKYTRGEFLSLAALVSGAAVVPQPASASGRPDSPAAAPPQTRGPGIEADLIVVNANVLTIDAAAPRPWP
jgi:hypothetical protein